MTTSRKTLTEQPKQLLQEKLVDTLDAAKVQLIESVDADTGAKRVYVRGEFGHAAKPTANKRLYPHSLWESQIERLSDQLKSKKVVGELDHPTDGRTSLQRVSHVITDLRLEGDLVIGEAEILDTAKGRDLKAIMAAGVPVGVSSRGYGSTKSNGKAEVVQEDYKLVTFDFVAEPADSTAYPDVFFEGVEIPEEAIVEDAKADAALAQKFVDKALADAPKKEETLADKFAAKVLAGVPEEPETMASKFAAKVLSDLGAKNVDAAQESFKLELIAQLVELKRTAMEEARLVLLADPEVAAAKQVVERVKEILRPVMVPVDIDAIVQERDTVIQDLGRQLSEARLALKERDESIGELTSALKEAGYRFYLERAISGIPDASLVRKMVGDVTRFESVEAVQTAIDEALDEIDKRQEVAEREREKQREQTQKLESRLHEAAEALRVAEEENRRLSLRLKAEPHLTNHPQAAKIRSMLESTNLESERDIAKVVDGFRTPERTPETMAKIRDRVRSLSNGGKTNLTESGSSEPARSPRQEGANYNGLGVGLAELKQITFGSKGRN